MPSPTDNKGCPYASCMYSATGSYVCAVATPAQRAQAREGFSSYEDFRPSGSNAGAPKGERKEGERKDGQRKDSPRRSPRD